MPLADLLSLLAPPICWGCGAPARGGEPLCRGCLRAIRWLPAEPVELGGVETWAPAAYDGPAAALVRALKFRGAEGVAERMAAHIAARAPAHLLEGATLVPVPLHPARERSRGFNQARRLAEALARRMDLPLADCLSRAGSPASQLGRPRAERLGAFGHPNTPSWGGLEPPDGSLAAAGISVALRPGKAAPSTALLVDDVATTGATLAASAGALRAAGSAHVVAVAYARTLGR